MIRLRDRADGGRLGFVGEAAGCIPIPQSVSSLAERDFASASVKNNRYFVAPGNITVELPLLISVQPFFYFFRVFSFVLSGSHGWTCLTRGDEANQQPGWAPRKARPRAVTNDWHSRPPGVPGQRQIKDIRKHTD